MMEEEVEALSGDGERGGGEEGGRGQCGFFPVIPCSSSSGGGGSSSSSSSSRRSRSVSLFFPGPNLLHLSSSLEPRSDLLSRSWAEAADVDVTQLTSGQR
ncbi:hypothetical protein Q8A73_002743 [Channa argus]|nr:hypothetical protein Q8A73_002743 [Channa argus]